MQAQLNLPPSTAAQLNDKSFQCQPKEETSILDQTFYYIDKPWFLGNIKKSEAEKVLKDCPTESFLVRMSKKKSFIKKAERTFVVSTFVPGSKKVVEYKYKLK